MRLDASVSASGRLADFEAAGVLDWGDIHAATKIAFLYGERDERVLLAFALAVAALRAGSVCLDLGDARGVVPPDGESVNGVPDDWWPDPVQWKDALAASPLVTAGAEVHAAPRPLRLVGDYLYLERYWGDETIVADELAARQAQPPPERDAAALRELLPQLFAGAQPDPAQAQAVGVALLAPVSVIAGGPGTGKTATVARVLAGLLALGVRTADIALAAPTGKAAARLEEAIADAVGQVTAALAHPRPGPARGVGVAPRSVFLSAVGDLGTLRAQTIHRLLGWVPDSRNRFAHRRSNPLPHDVVIVDEASMVSLPLMARLLEALRPEARLILVGDPDQLAPVEAGAVLADIVEAAAPTPGLAAALGEAGLPAGSVVRLRTNWRFSGALADLAQAVLAGDDAAALEILAQPGTALTMAADESSTDARERAVTGGLAMLDAARRGDAAGALAALARHRLLCAHRHGPFGVSTWTRKIESWLVAADPDLALGDQWYPGRPLLITQNAPEVGLWNGDTGVVLGGPEGARACFARGREIATYPVLVLDQVETAHAMTVHKAQGSQFDAVTLVLPPPDSPLLTRELLYTALTRAREHVTLIGTPESLRAAIQRRARRASGLAARLTG